VRRALLLALPALAAGLACAPKPGANPGATPALDTVEVTAKPDAQASLAGDAVAAPRPEATGVAGVLPPDFPKDVPLPEPSSIVDFVPHGVTLEVQAPRAQAQSDYFARLRARHFASGAGGTWSDGKRTLRVAFADASGATRITIEIR
jgi:hypothetical protein